MAEGEGAPKPDFRTGFSVRDLPDGGMVLGQVDAEDVILVRRGDEFFAVGASCTHYHGPLSDGLVVGDTLRCPWHHACFSLRTGEALRAPALDPISCWRVERVDDKAFVRPGVLHAERLVNMSKHQYRLEPNVSFTPDQKWVVFRSNMFGATYAFAVEVAKAQ